VLACAAVGLDDHRKRIDELDDQILKLLDERAGVVADVARSKRESNLPTYDPERERQVLDRLAARAGRFPPDAIRAVYRQIMSASLALQEPIKVAYLGPEGTFSHAAARAFFGLAATYFEATTFDGVFDTVSRHQALYGIVPVENSSEGTVPHAVDALVGGDLLIRAELDLEVSQCLLGKASGLPSIERVYSKAEVLGQCRIWLAKNLVSAQLVHAPSTAAAVREALTDPQGAAIASRLASELYGLPVMRERIQDRAENVTRFVVVSHEDSARTGNDKTTVAFSLNDGNGRGALMRALAVFDSEGLSLSRIESRPSREKSWDYVFLADLLGHRDDANVARAMAQLRATCPMVKHLGSYPRARRTA
jgi:chorismate mutase/prephenate dehydratase